MDNIIFLFINLLPVCANNNVVYILDKHITMLLIVGCKDKLFKYVEPLKEQDFKWIYLMNHSNVYIQH